MPEIITAEAVAAAEAQLVEIKKSTEPGDPERVRAMQAVNELRSMYRRAEEANPDSPRTAGHGVVVQDNTDEEVSE
jgi:hypothetical protein